MIKEIVILSGKGGTGKTSITGALAQVLTKTKTIITADCDTDAANFHQIINASTIKSEAFYSGKTARIKQDTCRSCGKCVPVCRFGAIETFNRGEQTRINSQKCEGCGVCDLVCYPTRSIVFKKRLCGSIKVSNSDVGLLSHGSLLPGGENSGHLVSEIRKQARELAEQEKAETILIDGPPGIGCQTIAALTGVAQVLIVAESGVSSLHDTKRIIELCQHFNIPATLCVNKADLNLDITAEIEKHAQDAGVDVAPRIPYDTQVIQAQLHKKTLLHFDTSPAAQAINKLATHFFNHS